MLRRWFIKRMESNLLTWLFKRWLKSEFDIELLSMTRCMIYEREMDVKSMFDKINRKRVLGFRHHLDEEDEEKIKNDYEDSKDD